ncbi:MAG: sugar transferase [Phycisphaerae bacterium]|nr:sugar transferase [Phycisphaerae bacterium]
MKRATDCLVAASVLLLSLPVSLIVAILIKLESRGPVLFVHNREGVGGKVFGCYKFRTMHQDAHRQQRKLYGQNELDGPQFKLRDDPRVTRNGRLLRATNIDELPQLINVLLGHMSLVGPRPSPFRENQICVPWRRARLSVRPGITGLWQICRSERSSDDFQQWIFYDTLYVRKMSAWLDLKILLATVLSLAGRWNVPLSYVLPDEGTQAEAVEPVGPAIATTS